MQPHTMRLLLLLSAILSALTGVAGPRSAVAQPVAASAPLAGQVARAQARALVVAKAYAPAPWVGEVAAHASLLRAFSLHAVQPLYADRLRE